MKNFIFACFLFLTINASFSQVNYVDVVRKNEKKSWTLKKGIGKITELKKDLYVGSKRGGYLIVYRFSSARILAGDLNNDGKKEHVVIVQEEGGGGGGNVENSNSYIVYDKTPGVFIVKKIKSEIINPPKNDDGYSFYFEDIKDGFFTGVLNVCKKRGQSKYDDEWEETQEKFKLVGDKLELVN